MTFQHPIPPLTRLEQLAEEAAEGLSLLAQHASVPDLPTLNRLDALDIRFFHLKDQLHQLVARMEERYSAAHPQTEEDDHAL